MLETFVARVPVCMSRLDIFDFASAPINGHRFQVQKHAISVSHRLRVINKELLHFRVFRLLFLLLFKHVSFAAIILLLLGCRAAVT